MMMVFLALAGGLGAVTRAVIDYLISQVQPPWRATFLINTTGSFLLGLASQLLTGEVLAVVGTGFLGGFTTFSTVSWQAARELGRNRAPLAASYATATLLACLWAAWLGAWLAG